MTGVVCQSMRRAALGDVWSGHPEILGIDQEDAQLVEQAWRALTPKHKELLRWYYIHNASSGLICRRLGIAAGPTSVFDVELAHAVDAIGRALQALAAAQEH